MAASKASPRSDAALPAPARVRGRRRGPIEEPSLVELTLEECLEQLRSSPVGRIAVIVEGFPVVLPVNHLLIESEDREALIALKTRTGTVIDTASAAVAYHVDMIDAVRREGSSVLVRGWLRHPGPDWQIVETLPALASWLTDRDTLLLIEPVAITGRRLQAAVLDWPFHPHGYI